MNLHHTIPVRRLPGAVILVIAAVTVLVTIAILGTRSKADSSAGAQTQVSALARPAAPIDSIPAGFLAEFSNVLAGGNLGSPVADSARRLSAGVDGAAVFAVTTTQGQLCAVILEVTGGCVSGFTKRNPVAWHLYDVDYDGSGAPAVLAGVAPDGVSHVDALSADGTVLASLDVSNNAFAGSLSSASVSIRSVSALRVDYAGGTSSTAQIR
jgi:hypothetical protein